MVRCRVRETALAGRPARAVVVVADAAYHGASLGDLSTCVTWTTRLPRNAVLYHQAPAPTGQRGRPRLKGDRIGTPVQAAATGAWRTVSVARCGRGDTVIVAVLGCLWSGVFGPLSVRMVLIRDLNTAPVRSSSAGSPRHNPFHAYGFERGDAVGGEDAEAVLFAAFVYPSG